MFPSDLSHTPTHRRPELLKHLDLDMFKPTDGILIPENGPDATFTTNRQTCLYIRPLNSAI